MIIWGVQSRVRQHGDPCSLEVQATDGGVIVSMILFTDRPTPDLETRRVLLIDQNHAEALETAIRAARLELQARAVSL